MNPESKDPKPTIEKPKKRRKRRARRKAAKKPSKPAPELAATLEPATASPIVPGGIPGPAPTDAKETEAALIAQIVDSAPPPSVKTALSPLEERVYNAVGEASMCWLPSVGNQVFDSSRAVKVAESLIADLPALMPPAPVAAPTPLPGLVALTLTKVECEILCSALSVSRERATKNVGYQDRAKDSLNLENLIRRMMA
jgi:hypothetical protein